MAGDPTAEVVTEELIESAVAVLLMALCRIERRTDIFDVRIVKIVSDAKNHL